MDIKYRTTFLKKKENLFLLQRETNRISFEVTILYYKSQYLLLSERLCIMTATWSKT